MAGPVVTPIGGSARGEQLPHPGTGQFFSSPVPPGTGWPGDPADRNTPVATTASGVSRLARAVTTLDELDACVTVCRACPRLVRWREEVAHTKRVAFAQQPYWGRPAPSWGDQQPRALIVGLAPAAHGANRTGRIFTGDRSGDWLYAALHRAGLANQPTAVHAADGLQLRGVRIASPVHCAPPENAPTTVEKATCAPWLEREITLLEPDLTAFLALGGVAWTQVLKTLRGLGWSVPKPAPKFRHGAQTSIVSPAGRSVQLHGCYHVSQHNTFTGRLTEEMLDDVLARL